MIYNTEADLHALIDSLTGGEHAKASWLFDRHVITAEGPVDMDGGDVRCDLHIRWDSGGINDRLISLEVIQGEEVITATRDDEKALHALIDSLEEGQEVTAEWHDTHGSMTLTGPPMLDGDYAEVFGLIAFTLRWGDGILHPDLQSVTIRRPVVQRWEREGDE